MTNKKHETKTSNTSGGAQGDTGSRKPSTSTLPPPPKDKPKDGGKEKR